MRLHDHGYFNCICGDFIGYKKFKNNASVSWYGYGLCYSCHFFLCCSTVIGGIERQGDFPFNRTMS